MTATDTSEGALEVARANAERLGLVERVRFTPGSVPDEGEFDLVLANLPYVSERDWSSLQSEVTQWEPREALLAGDDGLDAYRALLVDRGSPLGHIAPQRTAALAVEVGEGQAAAVAELMHGAGFARTEARRDLAGIERVVVGER